ncbi:unnamed protein product [Knipowitschia caucasica]
MELFTPFCTMLFYTLFGLTVGKYLYIWEKRSWVGAQEYCRKYHSDLALINSQKDQDLILQSLPDNFTEAWIGLYLVSSRQEWKWSGAGIPTYKNWKSNQPNDWNGTQSKVKMNAHGQWNDFYESHPLPFFCSKLIVKTQLSWERAFEHCRTKHTNLTGLTWDNERTLLLSQMQTQNVDLVWTGLRFFGDQWLWISGDPLKAARHDIDQCPVKERCGAINPKGILESKDCKENLYFMCD